MDTTRMGRGDAAIQRWLTAVGLLLAAEEQARVETAVSDAIAVVTAAAAAEGALGIIAGSRADRKGSDRFEDILTAALARAEVTAPPGIPLHLVDQLRAVQRTRSGALHVGTRVHHSEAERASEAARELFGLLPRLSGVPALPAGGIATAVAGLIGIEAVGVWMRFADDRVAAGDAPNAADAAARALDAALVRTRPPLPTDIRYVSRGEEARDVWQAMGYVEQRIKRLETWVVPFVIGLHPAAYRSLRETIGEVVPEDRGGHPTRVVRSATPDLMSVRRALETVTEIVWRLSSSSSLTAFERDDVIVGFAQEFIAKQRL